MKKQVILFSIFFISITLLSLTSCNSDDELISSVQPLPSAEFRTQDFGFYQTTLAASNHADLVQSWLLQKGNPRVLDLNKSIVTNKLSTNIKSIQVVFEDQNDFENQIVLLLENDSITGVILLEKLPSLGKMNWYNLKKELIMTTIFSEDPINSTTTVYAKGGKGQYIPDCIDKYYTKKGWLSVALFVGTLLDPGIGGAVAAGCGLSSLFCDC